MKSKKAASILEIDKLLLLQHQIKHEAKLDKEWAWNLSTIEDFAKAMGCLTPQSYGGRIEARLAHLIQLNKNIDKDKGDRVHSNGKCIEIKGSIISSTNLSINVVQIRPWQDIDYLIYCFDLRNLDDVKTQFFYLSKEDMDRELMECKASSAHGTKLSNIKNTNKELAIRPSIDGADYKRWLSKYIVTIEDVINK